MSDDKVVSIFVGGKTVPKADADLIEELESILQQAKDGIITGVAIAATASDGGVITAIHRTTGSSTFTLLGAVTHLFMRANKVLVA